MARRARRDPGYFTTQAGEAGLTVTASSYKKKKLSASSNFKLVKNIYELIQNLCQSCKFEIIINEVSTSRFI